MLADSTTCHGWSLKVTIPHQHLKGSYISGLQTKLGGLGENIKRLGPIISVPLPRKNEVRAQL